MQLLIPYAFVTDDPRCAQAAAGLQLPVLEQLLRRLNLTRTDTVPPPALAPPHEHALAQALGLPVRDGGIPWAAFEQARGGGDPGTAGWAWVTPAHWQIGSDRILMTDPAVLQLPEDESRALLQAMEPWFTQDGITLQFDTADRWLARGEVFAELASASLDRVIDTDLAPWLPATAALRRLQNEMQMLLYTHPINDARSARGLPTVNSFWISGSGALPAAFTGAMPEASQPVIAHALRGPALHGDWAGWTQAWQQIDQGACRELVAALERGAAPVELVLCSERDALHFTPAAGGWRERLQRRFRRTTLKDFIGPS